MIRQHRCSNCGREGKIYLPTIKPKETTIECYRCKEIADVGFYYNSFQSLEDIEWEEYQRLKKKFENGRVQSD